MMEHVGAVALLNFVVWFTVTCWLVFIRRLPIYHPIALVCLYHFLGFVARPLLIYLTGSSVIWDRTGVHPSTSGIYFTAVICNLGFAALIFGATLGTPAKRNIEILRPVQLDVGNRSAFYIACVVLLGLGGYGMIASYGGAGLDSIQAFEVSYDELGGQRLVGVSGYVTALAEFVPVVCILLFLDPKARAISLALLAAYIAIRLYIGAQRLSFVVALIGVYMIALINSGKRYPSVRLAIIALLFAFAFDIIGGDRFAFRKIFYGEADLASIIESYGATEGRAALISDVAEFDVAAAALSLIPDKTGWSYGTQYLRLLIWPIPRQLWEDKPIYTSIIDLNRHGNFLSLTHTLYVDAYMVWGPITMVMLLLLTGYALARLYENAKGTGSVLWFMLFWLQLIYMKTLLRDGGVTVIYFIAVSMAGVAALKVAGKLTLWRK